MRNLIISAFFFLAAALLLVAYDANRTPTQTDSEKLTVNTTNNR